MKKLTITLLLTLSFFVVFGQGLEPQYHKLVQDFIDDVKNQKTEKLAGKVRYPLMRDYPIAEVKTKQAFISRYNEIFDDYLVKKIVNSKPATDWDAVGWRGIMLDRGEVWLEYDGKLSGVTYQSKAEKKQKAELIKIEKKSLHPSIRTFKDPVKVFETSKYRIRIDDLGDYNYRYASWPLKSKMSDKPELIIKNGNYIPEGSGGNHRFEFKNGDYIYDCAIMEMTETGGAPVLLTITKGGKKILFQRAKFAKP